MAILHPEDDTGNGNASGAAPSELSASGLSRRGFARLGTGAGGVLLTLVSQPGMASVVCASPSQSLSKWSSHHVGEPVQCSGLSPGGWKDNPKASANSNGTPPWPSPQDRQTLMFSSIFPSGARSPYSTALMDTMLSPQSLDAFNIGGHFAATYLNIISNRINFLTVSGLQIMWNEWFINGVYHPTAGITWDGEAIVAYLKSTMA